MRSVFNIARTKRKTLSFVCIGNKNFQKVDSSEQITKVFDFNDSHTFISFALEQAEERGIISPDSKQSIIIVSDMEPDHTNTPESWDLLAEDYQDLLDSYKKISEWIELEKQIHIILLKHPSPLPIFSPDVLLNHFLIIKTRKVRKICNLSLF